MTVRTPRSPTGPATPRQPSGDHADRLRAPGHLLPVTRSAAVLRSARAGASWFSERPGGSIGPLRSLSRSTRVAIADPINPVMIGSTMLLVRETERHTP